VITFGGIGSNHVVATGLYSRLLDLRCAAVVFPQPMSIHVRQNLLVDQAAGVRLHPIRSKYLVPKGGADLWTRLRLTEGRGFHLIAPGGSSPMGAAGMVTAGLELAAQVREGLLPEPDELYLPLGSMGTAAGIAIGLALAGLRTRVHAVRVVDRLLANSLLTRRTIRQTLALLQSRCGGLPDVEPEVTIRQGFFGKAYGHYTLAGQEAIATLRRDEGLELEGTYSGKAFACLLDDARQGTRRGRTTLFWITCNGQDLSRLATQGDAELLPAAVRREFEKADHQAI
jgi:1-aminocyclopropane-1-carboxylate deaminase/D-cysteine desulfhydrase-like pyridoxal-dependent ACC family enzyme